MTNHTETPANIEAWIKIKHKEWNKGHKANLCVCGFHKVLGSITIKCAECGKDCFYSLTENSDMMVRKVKKICIECALFTPKWRKKLNDEQAKILERAYDINRK